MEWPSLRVDNWAIALLLAGGGVFAIPDVTMAWKWRFAIILWVAAGLLFVCGFPEVQRWFRSTWNRLLFSYRRTAGSHPWGAPVGAGLVIMVLVVLLFGGVCWLLKGKSLEVIGIAPVDVFSRHRFTIGEQDLESVDHGISFVLRVRNGDQVSFINGVSLAGKLHLDSKGLLFFAVPENAMSVPTMTWEILMEKHPYVAISWSGGPLNNIESIKLEPSEESFIKLTVHEVGKVVPGYFSPKSNYLGYDDGDQVPVWMIEAADPDMFFPGTGGVVLRQFAGDIHNDFRNGAAQITLKIGALSVPIEPSKIQTIRRVKKKDWEEGSAQEIYFGNSYYKSPKDIAPYNPALK